jgi:WhiB family redox-sensing transcriptional regulator
MADVRRLPGPNTDLWDWQLEGACRGLDSSLFFHPDNERGPSRARRENEAKAICASCPVVEPCRQLALEVREPYGVWGGLSEAERNQLLGTGRGDALLAPEDPAVITRMV